MVNISDTNAIHVPFRILLLLTYAKYPVFVKTTSTPVPVSCTGWFRVPVAVERSIQRVSPVVFGNLLE